MPNYLSPNRLKRMETGQRLPTSDLALSDLISQSQAIVDSYCQLPLQPYPMSFLGGEDIVEEHRWRFPERWHMTGQRRIYPYHKPIRAVSSLSLVVGQGAAAEIPQTSLVINNTEGWVEITALSIANSSGLFGVTGWVVPIGGLSEPMARITLDAGWEIPEVADVCFASDADNKVFVSSHEHWFEDSDAPEIKVAGVVVTTGFTIDYLEGTITFDSTQTGRVTASYRHRLPREIPLGTGLVAIHLAGEAELRRKAMEGIESVKDDQIEIRRERSSGSSAKSPEEYIEKEVPEAAKMLGGFKYWRIG